MIRTITGFVLDDESHWCARLSCGHRRHTRHDPPMVERPWVLTEEGRAEFIGADLDCVRCDDREMPDDFVPYKKTRVFTDETLPAAIRANHSTRAGVFALIHVEAGSLLYRIAADGVDDITLTTDAPGVVLPEEEHGVEPAPGTRFYIEFWRAKSGEDDRAHTTAVLEG